MINKFLVISFLSFMALASCKRIETLKGKSKGTIGLVVPVNFEWKSSRNIKFIVNVSDRRFGNLIHMITLYDGDPALGGKLLSKGASSTANPFITSIYLSNQFTAVYLVKTAPNNSSITTKVPVGIEDVTVTMGQ